MGIFACFLCTGPGCVAEERVAHEPIKNFFFVCYSSVEFFNVSPICYQSQAIQGPVPQEATTKAGVLDMCTELATWSGLERKGGVHRLP